MNTLSDALDELEHQGFTEHFGVRGHQLRGFDSGAVFEANEVVIRGFDRFEGVSDPDDMSILYAIESLSGVRGTLTDAFGVYSNPVISAFVNNVAIRRSGQRLAAPVSSTWKGRVIKVALIGVGGRVGSRLAAELLRRGHSVTGIERNPDKAEARPGITVKQGDATQPKMLTPLITGHDAVLSASRFQTSDANALITAVKKAGVKRLLVVGGASSLEVAPGKPLIDASDFPEAYKAEARAGVKFLEVLRKETDLDWTFLSPSAEFAPGARTGKFRVGKDQLLVDPEGKSRISMEDFAVALVDELEHPRHSRQRFTVGY